MLSSTAHTLQQKARLAVSLAWIGGFVDAVGLMVIHSFTSNMTGNTAQFGARFAERSWETAFSYSYMIAMFVLGATLSGVLTVGGRRRGVRSIYSQALGVEAVVLGLFVLNYSGLASDSFYVLAALPCIAMGLQNATITQIGGSVVRTTHVTGVLTDLGLESVQFIFWFRDRTRGRFLQRLKRAFRLSPRHPSLQRLFLLISIWASFFIGVVLGAWGFARFDISALVAPIGFLLFLIVLDFLRPIATLHHVQHERHDQELKSYGIDPGMVPPSVAVYRVKGTGAHRVRPPDLGRISEKADRKLRVVVLMFSHHIELDNNSIEGLLNTVSTLRSRRCETVLCTTDPPLFVQIRDSTLADEVGAANICSDPEFAIARAIELVNHPAA